MFIFNFSRKTTIITLVLLTVTMMSMQRNDKAKNSLTEDVDFFKCNLHADSTLDEENLKKLVEETFVNGALNSINVERMARGFHPKFAILMARGSNLERLFLSEWVDIVKAYKDDPVKMKSGIRNLDYTINVLDITGSTAIVKTQFYRDNKLIITDYLSYIKYAEGWKAVSKISHDHVVDPLQLNF